MHIKPDIHSASAEHDAGLLQRLGKDHKADFAAVQDLLCVSRMEYQTLLSIENDI